MGFERFAPYPPLYSSGPRGPVRTYGSLTAIPGEPLSSLPASFMGRVPGESHVRLFALTLIRLTVGNLNVDFWNLVVGC